MGILSWQTKYQYLFSVYPSPVGMLSQQTLWHVCMKIKRGTTFSTKEINTEQKSTISYSCGKDDGHYQIVKFSNTYCIKSERYCFMCESQPMPKFSSLNTNLTLKSWPWGSLGQHLSTASSMLPKSMKFCEITAAEVFPFSCPSDLQCRSKSFSYVVFNTQQT